ncbi:MAG TPA: hypothetical protein P5230_01940 [Candidatus Magasanikbacteria bacterium]|nr:hypothetical protein [Candidatus Magasanikbacteria bacterium]
MKSTYGKLFLVILVTVTCALFKIEAASAQLSISIYPLSFKAQVNPGDTWRGSVTVINPNDFAISVRPEKENLVGGSEGEIILTGETDQNYGLASWVKYDSNKEIILAAGERRKVDFSLIVPANAQPGGHYGAVLFRGTEINKKSSGESGLGVAGRVGSVMLFEVSGDVQKTGEISSLETKKFIAHGPIDLTFKVKNTGNTFFLPEGKVEFKHFFKTFETTWEPRVVFPGYDRTFKTNLDKKYLFGPVKATILAKMSDGAELTPISVTIWAWPWKETLVLLCIIVTLWLLKLWLLKNFKIVKIEKTENKDENKKGDA